MLYHVINIGSNKENIRVAIASFVFRSIKYYDIIFLGDMNYCFSKGYTKQ